MKDKQDCNIQSVRKITADAIYVMLKDEIDNIEKDIFKAAQNGFFSADFENIESIHYIAFYFRQKGFEVNIDDYEKGEPAMIIWSYDDNFKSIF
jgi:hypothetical protein